MARPELTHTNSLLAFVISIHRNQQILCIGDSTYLLCMFVDAFVRFPAL